MLSRCFTRKTQTSLKQVVQISLKACYISAIIRNIFHEIYMYIYTYWVHFINVVLGDMII